MSIATKSGDDGSTGLGDGSRVDKADTRIELLGTLDELNAAAGLCLADGLPEQIAQRLQAIQSDLLLLGAQASGAPGKPLPETALARLDAWLTECERELPPLRSFILPGGRPPAARLHWLRCLVRRTERCLIAVPVDGHGRAYLNRLSDLLFQWARWCNGRGADDIPWHGPA